MQEKMLEELGYNDPILIQYFKWLLRALQGDLGYSIQFKQPVLSVISKSFRKYSDFIFMFYDT